MDPRRSKRTTNNSRNGRDPSIRSRSIEETIESVIGSSRPTTIIEEIPGLPSNDPSLDNLSIPDNSIMLPPFHGDSCEITIENWLSRFEELAELKSFDDRTKMVQIGNYLRSEALDWYMTTRKHNTDLNFDKLKTLFINRFGLRVLTPIIELTRLKYDPSKGITEYYQAKRRLGSLAELSESHIISLMIDGLPTYLSHPF